MFENGSCLRRRKRFKVFFLIFAKFHVTAKVLCPMNSGKPPELVLKYITFSAKLNTTTWEIITVYLLLLKCICPNAIYWAGSKIWYQRRFATSIAEDNLSPTSMFFIPMVISHSSAIISDIWNFHGSTTILPYNS